MLRITLQPTSNIIAVCKLLLYFLLPKLLILRNKPSVMSQMWGNALLENCSSIFRQITRIMFSNSGGPDPFPLFVCHCIEEKYLILLSSDLFLNHNLKVENRVKLFFYNKAFLMIMSRQLFTISVNVLFCENPQDIFGTGTGYFLITFDGRRHSYVVITRSGNIKWSLICSLWLTLRKMRMLSYIPLFTLR